RLDRDGDAPATRRRLRVPLHLPPNGRFPPWPAPGPRRSPRPMAQAAEAPFDRRGNLPRAARLPDDPRMSRPGGTARLPCDDPDRGHDVAGRRRIYPGRSRTTLPCPLECRAGSEVVKTDNADGHLALPNAGVGPQGALDAHPGLQPDPH